MHRLFVTLAATLTLAGSAAAQALTVKPITAPALKAAIAHHRGHVVLVDFWSTACGPCVAEFPLYAALARELKPKGLDFIAVSADSPRDLLSKVRPFYARQHLTGTHYVQTPGDASAFALTFDPAWQPAALPRAYIYNRQGRRVRTLVGPQTRAGLIAALGPLLK